MLNTDIKWIEKTQTTKKQLSLYLKNKGDIPEEIQEENLNNTIKLIQKQIDEIELLEDKKELSIKKVKSLKKELQEAQEELLFHLKYFKKNKYKIFDKVNQDFKKRKKYLKIQKIMLSDLMDEMDISRKSSIRKINDIIKNTERIVNFPSFDFIKMYEYVCPYMEKIITTPDYGYDFLVKNLYLDY